MGGGKWFGLGKCYLFKGWQIGARLPLLNAFCGDISMCLGKLQQICCVVVIDVDVLDEAIVLQQDLVVLVAI